MTHRFLALLTFCCVGILLEAGIAQAAGPNIVLIMADDIGYECFGSYGSKQYQTPNLDRMASAGVRFEHCYSQPLCTPSRVKMMTGLSNARNYSAFSILNRDQRTFGHILKEAGYRTFVGGKWQLYGAEHYYYPQGHYAKGTLPQDAGFDEYCLWQIEKLGERYWNPLLSINGELTQFTPDDYGPDIVTDHICDFMSKESDKPFFVYYPMILTHSPFPPAPDSEDKKSKNDQKNFEDMVAYMDKLVGRIVAKTEEVGIAEETLILFTGDNGTGRKLTSVLNGREIKGGKGMMTDAGTRVALIAYQPGKVESGKVCSDIVDFSDFVPTLQEVAGIPVDNKLDGVSFAPALTGTNPNAREWIYCYYYPRPEWENSSSQRFVRDQRYKLYGDGRFYDVANDPLERKPLEAQNDTRKKLAAVLEKMPAESPTLLKFPE